MVSPGVSVGTMICVIFALRSPALASSVRHITMRKSARRPFEVNHLWPLITHSLPSRRAVVLMERGSEPAESGSVIEKPDSIFPSVRGISHFSICSLVPYLRQDLLVARVGGDHPEQRGGAHRVGEHLVHVGVLEEVEATSAELLRQMGSPEARLLDLGLDALAQVVGVLARAGRGIGAAAHPELVLVGEDLVVHDARGLHPDLVDPVGHGGDGLDVHRHGRRTSVLERCYRAADALRFVAAEA